MSKKHLIIIASVLAIISILLCIVFFIPKNDMEAVVLKGKNNTVNKAMITYYAYSISNEYISNAIINNGSNYLDAIGLDSGVSLKKQESCYGDKTWFEYFYDSAVNRAKEYLYYVEKAEEKTFPQSKVDDNTNKKIKDLKKIAKSEGKSFSDYLTDKYEKGVLEKDVFSALLLEEKAKWYLNNIHNTESFSTEKLNEYVNSNPDKFLLVDYSYLIVNIGENKSPSEIRSVANDLAEQIKINEFDKIASEFTNKNKNSEFSTVNEYRYDSSSILTKWLFDDKTAIKDSKVFEINGSYLVVQKNSNVYKENYSSANLRLCIINTLKGKAHNNLQIAEQVYNELSNAKELNAGKFESIVSEFGFDAVEKGSALKGEFGYTGFDDWCFDVDRKPGDFMSFGSEDTFCFAFFSSHGDECWKVQAKQWCLEDSETKQKNKIYKKYKILN